ncbi:MAG TPA: hypothetical protein VK772_12580 [Puia sp.]|jgi:hypothetical protein|nr:hypothetical protein [Puia sp.]
MQHFEQQELLHIELELEKKYPFFKKMDIHTTVSNAFQKTQHDSRKFTSREFEKVKKMADHDLQLS